MHDPVGAAALLCEGKFGFLTFELIVIQILGCKQLITSEFEIIMMSNRRGGHFVTTYRSHHSCSTGSLRQQ